MTEGVTVTDRLFERQYLKTVLTADGVREVPPGQLPAPTDQVLAVMGEPSFRVALANVVRSDHDVPDEVGFALRRAAKRLYDIMADGREDSDCEGPVEWVLGPVVHDAAVAVWLDTDGAGSGRAMVEAMTKILVEELEPLGVRAEISAASAVPSPIPPVWTSEDERRQR